MTTKHRCIDSHVYPILPVEPGAKRRGLVAVIAWYRSGEYFLSATRIEEMEVEGGHIMKTFVLNTPIIEGPTLFNSARFNREKLEQTAKNTVESDWLAGIYAKRLGVQIGCAE